MRTGVGYPNFGDTAVWSGSGWSPDYPVTNLSDQTLPSRAARAAAAGVVAAGFILPTAQSVQMLALIQHNLQPGDTMRVQLANGGTQVADSGALPVWPIGGPAPRLAPTRPLVLSSPVMADRGTLTISSAAPAQIGAVEIASWWQWKGVSLGRKFGFDARNPMVQDVGGATSPVDGSLPRLFTGQIDYIALGAPTDMVLDFQADMDLDRTFVLISDADDPSTWARMAFQATNQTIPALAGVATRHDRNAFAMVENQR